MNRGLVFFLGIITGFILTVGTVYIITKVQTSDTNHNGISLLEERGQLMEESSFKIFQTLDDTHALATGVSNEEYGWYRGITVMVIGHEDDHFYDGQIVKRISGKKFYQVGTYRYRTKSDNFKTVPVVQLLNAE